MRVITALLLAIAVITAPVGLPIGAASAPDSIVAAQDCAGDCHCDKAADCGTVLACAWQCAFNASAVALFAAPASRLAHATGLASVQGELSALFIRPPLPPPQV